MNDAWERVWRLRRDDETIKTLVEALKPFAAIARELSHQLRDDQKTGQYWSLPRVGDFRRALDALRHMGVDCD